MHNTIYEISDKPIHRKQRATTSCLPEWFFQTVADSATDMSSDERTASMESLDRCFGRLCTRNGEQLLFTPDLKQEYFKESHQFFKEAAAALAETEYDVFAGITSAAAFGLALHSLEESYADKFGCYVYDPDSEELSALDTWLRSVDVSKPYYIGGTVGYHC